MKPRVESAGRWLAVSLLLPGAVLAFPLHYSDDRPEAVQVCDQLRYDGQSDAATDCYQTLLDAGDSDALARADAARALGDHPLANRLYRQLSQQASSAAVLTHWAELYMDSHQTSDAMSLYREALEREPGYAPAEIGLAVALSQTYQGQAREQLARLVAKQPTNLRATIELARIELDVQNLDKAERLLDTATRLAGEQGYPVSEILGLRAGHALLSGESMEPFFERALAINPHYGDVFSIAAHYYIITYRYREAVDLYRRAVAAEPDHASAYRDLGINLLRVNRIFDARYHLELAYQLDPYDILTVNSLRLLDQIDTMRVMRIDVPSETDPTDILARVVIRLDRAEADAIVPYVVDLTERAVRTFTERFDFRLQRPMIVELYDDHDDFGVRTVSTPGIGLLGVTFGYLTAMDSPRARAVGEFHWGSTLWHEIAHVFTLEASEHRLPRWMGEGLSVHEEWRTGPLPSTELSLDVLRNWSEGNFLSIADLDQGFVRPSYAGQVQVSYMQAGLIVDFIRERWGMTAVQGLIRGFTQGRSTRENIAAELGMRVDEFDTAFEESMQQRFGTLSARLPRYGGELRFLARLVENKDWSTVESLAKSLIDEYPERVSSGSAWIALAEAQRQLGKNDEAIETELNWLRRGGHEPDVMQALADRLRANGREDEAVEVLEALNWVMPYSSGNHSWLGLQYLDRGDAERAAREFDAALGTRNPDRAPALYGKARAELMAGRDDAALRAVLRALESAPFYRPAQTLLLELNEGDS